MPRMKQISAAQERQELRDALSKPSMVLATLTYDLHVRNDVPGRICPCCGSPHAWSIGSELEGRVLISTRKQTRRNEWQIMTPDGRALFDETAALAEPWGTPKAKVWHTDIRFTCGVEQMQQIRCLDYTTAYWSGGWRSMKSFTAGQAWGHKWFRRGARGQMLWQVGPEVTHAFKMMTRAFIGREGDGDNPGTPPIFPTYRDASGEIRSQVATGLPKHKREQELSFMMLDGAVVELHHTRSIAALEGDDVLVIHMDEIVRMKNAEGYQICRGRVTQCGGHVLLSSVPDDDGWWVFDEIVGPWMAKEKKNIAVYQLPTRGNLWLSPERAQQLADDCGNNETLRKQKVDGEWVRSGLFAYLGHYDPARHVLDVAGHDPVRWGFKYDVTKQVTRALFKKPLEYIGGRDFNEQPQTGLVAKVFAQDRTDKSTWCLVILDEHITKGDARRAAKDFKGFFRGGKYYKAGIGWVCDCNGFHEGHRYGGRASRTSDAFEFQSQGMPCVPPITTPVKRGADGRKISGGEGANPGVSDSKKMVRWLWDVNAILIDSECTQLWHGLPRVPWGTKDRRKAGTWLDKTVQNVDDCLRYLCERVFGELYADTHDQKPKATSKVAGLPSVGIRH